MPTIPAKSGTRAKILAYLSRNGLSPLADIMTGIGEPNRAKAHSNVQAALTAGLVVRERDDVTNQPAYKLTDAGREWIEANKHSGKPAPAPETPVCTKSQTAATPGDSEGGEADAPAQLTEAQREEFTLLGVIADIRKAICDEGRIMLGDLAEKIGEIDAARQAYFNDFQMIAKECEPLIEALIPEDKHNIRRAIEVAIHRIHNAAAIERERDELRKSLESEKRVCANINTDLATIARHVGSDPCYNGPTTITRVIDAIREESDDLRARLDAVTQQSVKDIGLITEKNAKLHSEIDHLRADIASHQQSLKLLKAENLALKTLEETMPGFGAEYQAQRIKSLEAELLEARAEAVITKESPPAGRRFYAITGFILRAVKRPELGRLTYKQHENAVKAATTAIRKGAKRVRLFALVPHGQVVPGAEFQFHD